MPDLPRIPVRRVLDEEGDLEVIGLTVPDAEPNITKAGVYVDEETGRPVFAYAPFPDDFTAYRNAVIKVEMSTTLRAAGTRNVSRTFGFSPKSVVIKRESCRPAALSYWQPEEHAVIVGAARTLDRWLQAELPEVVDRAFQESVGISDEWRMTDDVYWTSGVINKTSALPYHRDRNNFPVWSAMPVARRGARGGYLRLPAYDAVIAARDGWVVYFNGFELTHGVTPITVTAKDGYRYSCVYYCLRKMVNCADDAREQGRARVKRTEREREIASETTEQMLSKFKGARMKTQSFKAIGSDKP